MEIKKVTPDAGTGAGRRTAIFFGAGASRAEGAPLQGDLFRVHFLQKRKERCQLGRASDAEIATFFHEFFGIDVHNDDLGAVRFPTFEEVLGILEIATSQQESFRGWGNSNLVNGSQRIQSLRELLVLLIAEVLHNTLGNDPSKHHKRLLKTLGPTLPNVTFLSFNYDILLDNALVDLYPKWDLDYGFDFSNYADTRGWRPPRSDHALKLFKLHGSLNWLYCPTCRSVELTPKEKGVCRLIWDPGSCVCDTCDTQAVPIVIPPTYFKTLANLQLRRIWDAAERDLMECERIVFCGYSFPDADVHVRYLLKRVELNRPNRPLEIFVVNHFAGKSSATRDEERGRYLGFVRNSALVRWTDLSFEDFAEQPSLIDDRHRWVS
jgi:NAD-dependent SIR2 family protein deacetylase